MIHCIGDSHVCFFSGEDKIEATDILPYFRTYRIGPFTAQAAILKRDVIEATIKTVAKPGDMILFGFGEIDCRVHLLKQSEKHKQSLEDVVHDCVENYFKLFQMAKQYGFPLLAWNVPPSSRDTIECGEYSTYGTCEQRNEVSRLFNATLRKICQDNGVIFLSIFESLLDREGLTNSYFYMDQIHLSQKAMPLALEEFRNKGILLGSDATDEKQNTLLEGQQCLRIQLQDIKSPTGSLRPDFLKAIAHEFNLSVFVETGTFMGDTSASAASVFKTVHTVELSKDLFRNAVKRFEGQPNIILHNGDSSRILPQILNEIKGNIFFWLDGHFSEGVTAKGAENTPVIKELKAIQDAGLKGAVILIDDLRCFDAVWATVPQSSGARDYPSMSAVTDALLAIDKSYQIAVLGDAVMAYPHLPSVSVSPVVAACTLSRMYLDETREEQAVLDAEKAIGRANNTELTAICTMYERFKSSEVYGFCRHYRLWHALTRIEEKDYGKACIDLLIAIGLGFEHWRVQWYLAAAAYEGGYFAIAEKALNVVLLSAPDFAEAIHLNDKLMRHPPEGGKEKTLSTELHLELAAHLQSAGKYENAITELELALKEGGSESDIYPHYAELIDTVGHHKTGRKGKAKTGVSKERIALIKDFLLQPAPVLERANRLQQLGRNDEASKLLEIALKAGNESIDVHYYFAQLLIARRRIQEAVRELGKILLKHPAHTWALNDLGVIHYQEGSKGKAIEYFTQALQANIHNANALTNLFSALVAVGHGEEAERLALAMRQQLPHDADINAAIQHFNAHGAAKRTNEQETTDIESFNIFLAAIHPCTWERHDEILQWAEKCELYAATLESDEAFANCQDPVVQQGNRLARKAREEFRGRYKDANSLRIMIQVPALHVSPAGYSLTSNLASALRHIGIPVYEFEWDKGVEQALMDFEPTIFMASDHELYLSRINWDAIARYRQSHTLHVGLTASLAEYGNTPLLGRLKWARDHHIDFFYSFRSPLYLKHRKEYQPFYEQGYTILSMEFAANPLIHYPVPGVKRDVNFIFLGSINRDKWSRYISFFAPIMTKENGFLDGPGWPAIRRKSNSFRKDRYLYARAMVGLNLHNADQIEWANELNERTYILAACGIPQLIDEPLLLKSRFSEDGFFIGSNPKQYAGLYQDILSNPDEAQGRVLVAQREVFASHTWFHRAEKLAVDLLELFYKDDCGLIYDSGLGRIIPAIVRGKVARVGGAVSQLLTFENCQVQDLNLRDGGYSYAMPDDKTLIMDMHDATTHPNLESQFDGTVSSNVLEHSYDPIRFLLNCYFVTRENGFQYHVLPLYRNTYDVFREPTTLEHMVSDFVKKTDSTDSTHVQDYSQSAIVKHGWQAEFHKTHAVAYPFMHCHVFDELNAKKLFDLIFEGVVVDVFRPITEGAIIVLCKNKIRKEFKKQYPDLFEEYAKRRYSALIERGESNGACRTGVCSAGHQISGKANA